MKTILKYKLIEMSDKNIIFNCIKAHRIYSKHFIQNQYHYTIIMKI